MPSFKTIQIVNPRYPQKYSIINEKDFDPKKHTLFGADVPVVIDYYVTKDPIAIPTMQEPPKNKGGRPKGSQNKKKTKKKAQKQKEQNGGDSKDQEVEGLHQDTP